MEHGCSIIVMRAQSGRAFLKVRSATNTADMGQATLMKPMKPTTTGLMWGGMAPAFASSRYRAGCGFKGGSANYCSRLFGFDFRSTFYDYNTGLRCQRFF